ncbi:hypothetical protein AB0B51_26555, partial [Streptomyces griseus]|uniref:hypothetical protein n=1 Tax=Streptomyces griseus TaxID=1911 RepID=UPI0033E9252F
MPSITTSKVSRWDQHGREHVVRVRKSGVTRQLSCSTCAWRRSAQFLPWLKAERGRAGDRPLRAAAARGRARLRRRLRPDLAHCP